MDLGSGKNSPQHHSTEHHSPAPQYQDMPSSSYQYPPSSYDVPFPSMLDMYYSLQQRVDHSQRTYVLSDDTSTRMGHLETVVQHIYRDMHYLRGLVQQRLGDDDSEQEEEDTEDEEDDDDIDSG
ncbi:hypothetical protein L1987_40059 [Smallanthus sonchifolius]|uniref:Uncharacterized protein n=1 Tax=Smallanthus sonchifolius TaxID=185202 RepID=A0ACB9GTL0_9ASTR|nr:hypothetical protein L1987_40059 [Smallanthus sonchifolius]